MNEFKLAFRKVFTAMKRTISLVLSYLLSAIVIFLALGLIITVADSYISPIGCFLLIILSVFFLFVGVVGFIDTIILQVKTYE